MSGNYSINPQDEEQSLALALPFEVTDTISGGNTADVTFFGSYQITDKSNLMWVIAFVYLGDPSSFDGVGTNPTAQLGEWDSFGGGSPAIKEFPAQVSASLATQSTYTFWVINNLVTDYSQFGVQYKWDETFIWQIQPVFKGIYSDVIP